jgi:ApbE superfamily uncharacterized protein (UPF0280 family)
MFSDRFYRRGMGEGRFEALEIKEGESDLWIGLPPGSELGAIGETARARLRELRSQIASYAAEHPSFYGSLEPLSRDPAAAGITAAMLRASEAAGVGPMASVAGAVSGALGSYLVSEFGLSEIVIENGGDTYIKIDSPLTVSIYAGLSSLSQKIGLIVPPELSPLGVCTSSSKVGPSLSFGNADACLVASPDCALADAFATTFGNRIRAVADIAPCLEDAAKIPEILSLVIIRGDTAGAIGQLKLKSL